MTRLAILRATVVLLLPVSLPAQTGGLEVFGGAGMVRVSTDDGLIGDARSVGGSVTVPLTSRWVAEGDLARGKVRRTAGSPDNIFATRRTMVVGCVLYRQCGPKACFFVGYDLGAQFVDSLNQFTDSSPDLRR